MTSPALDAASRRHLVCAARLRERRRELKLTQADVAARVQRHGPALTNRTEPSPMATRMPAARGAWAK